MKLCDFHSHVLPGADHGSSSVEVSLNQLSLAARHGVNRIIATPHFYPHRVDVHTFLKRRNGSYHALKSHMDDSVELRLGAEVLLCSNIENLPGIEKLCIYGSNVILLELPFTDFSSEYVDSFGFLIDKGFTPIIAHADRYDPSNIEKLFAIGVKAQLNASSLCGLFKNPYLFDWIAREKIVALGSDIHGEDRAAYKKFVKATKRIGDTIDFITEASDHIWSLTKPYSHENS